MTKENEITARTMGSTSSIIDETSPLLANAMEKNIGISQQTLVSYPGDRPRARKLPQYIAGLASTLGALAAGMVLAWTSPAGEEGVNIQKGYPDIAVTADQFSWIGSLATLGAGAICVPIGILSDLIGRKTSMLILVVPFTIGWLCMIFADSVTLFYVGRFITGLAGGAFCVTAPMYTAEIAESDIRGSLGSYFQLLLTIGILFTYILGKYVNMFILSIISAIIPLIFFGVFFFMPETPIYYLKKGNEDAARASLIRLRGEGYNVDNELREQRESIEETMRSDVSLVDAMMSKAVVKGLIIAYGLMLFQQLSGVNAVIFYAGDIFNKAGSSLDPNDSAIIVGVMQVAAVFVSTLIVDRLGRRILLLISNVAMFITTLILGVYFYLQNNGNDVSSIGWLPLLSVCAFIILFSLGFGPIPWMMMGEIFAPEVKGIAASSACLFNWLMAFVVTKFYNDINGAIGVSGTFFIFSGICAVGIFFVFFIVPETKGKSLEDIQRELGGM